MKNVHGLSDYGTSPGGFRTVLPPAPTSYGKMQRRCCSANGPRARTKNCSIRTVTPGTACRSKEFSAWTASLRRVASGFASLARTCRSNSLGA